MFKVPTSVWSDAYEAQKEKVFVIVHQRKGVVQVVREDEVAQVVIEANGFNENDAASLEILKRDGLDSMVVGRDNEYMAYYALLPIGSKLVGKPDEILDDGWLFITNDEKERRITVIHNSDFYQAFIDDYGFDQGDRGIMRYLNYGEEDVLAQRTAVKVKIPLKDGISKFEVRVTYLMSSLETVYGVSRDEAIKSAKDMEIPNDGEYIDSTFEVTHCSYPNEELGEHGWEVEEV